LPSLQREKNLKKKLKKKKRVFFMVMHVHPFPSAANNNICNQLAVDSVEAQVIDSIGSVEDEIEPEELQEDGRQWGTTGGILSLALFFLLLSFSLFILLRVFIRAY
jgi:hypothetical protein